jgi:hypothetical protein
MADRLPAMTTAELETALVALGRALDYPRPGGDLASRVRERLEQEPAPSGGWWRRLLGGPAGVQARPLGRPLRPALVLAILLLLVAAAAAVAVALGVPGIRIVFAPPGVPPPAVSASPSGPAASAGSVGAPLGSSLGLGQPISFDEAEANVGFPPRLPAGLGRPPEAYADQGRLTLLWPPTTGLPAIPGTSIGLLATEFRGEVDREYYEKVVGAGSIVEPVTVAGNRGYWITGDVHQLFYVDPSGNPEFETRRVVGQVLLWSDGELTFRLETALGRDDAIRLAESMQ